LTPTTTSNQYSKDGSHADWTNQVYWRHCKEVWCDHASEKATTVVFLVKDVKICQNAICKYFLLFY